MQIARGVASSTGKRDLDINQLPAARQMRVLLRDRQVLQRKAIIMSATSESDLFLSRALPARERIIQRGLQ